MCTLVRLLPGNIIIHNHNTTCWQKHDIKTALCSVYSFSLWLVEEGSDDFVLALGVVEVDKQAPMNQPCSLLQLLQWRSV